MRCCLRATGQWSLPLIDLKRGKKKRRWRTEQNPCWPESSQTSLQQLQSRPSGAYLVLFALLAESISPGKNKTNNEYEIWLQIGIKFSLLFTPNPQNSFTSCDKKVSAQESAWIHQVDKLHGSSICSVCLTKKHKNAGVQWSSTTVHHAKISVHCLHSLTNMLNHNTGCCKQMLPPPSFTQLYSTYSKSSDILVQRLVQGWMNEKNKTIYQMRHWTLSKFKSQVFNSWLVSYKLRSTLTHWEELDTEGQFVAPREGTAQRLIQP